MKNTIFVKLIAIVGLLSVGMLGLTTGVFAEKKSSKTRAIQYFVNLKNGDVVNSPVKIIFGLSGMGVAPAGFKKDNTGHHHLFINRPPLGQGEDGADELKNNIPADENHIHFGGGQTETLLELKPGKHTLQLVLADENHIPHNPPVASEVITITVK